MRLKSVIALILVCLVLPLTLRAVFPVHYKADHQASQRRAIEARVAQIQRDWQGQEFRPLAETGVEAGLLRRAAEAGHGLSAAQQDALAGALARVLAYLRQPTPEAYLGLRGGHGFHLSTGLLARLSGALPPGTEQDAARAVPYVWDAIHRQAPCGGPPRVAELAPASVAAALGRTNSAQALLGGPVARGFTVAVEAVNPGYAVPAEGPFLHLGFVARLAGATNAGPFHLTLAWNGEQGRWEPARLLADRTLGVETLF